MGFLRAPAGAGLLLGALVLASTAACSPKPEPASAIPPLAGTEPNGEQKRTAAQLVADARASLRVAAAVDLSGDLDIGGSVVTLDLVSSADGSVSGTLTLGGGSAQVQLTASDLYVRATGTPDQLVALLGLPGFVAGVAPGSAFWRLDPAAAPTLSAYGLPALAATLLPASLVATPGLVGGDADGTPVVTAAAGGLAVSVAVTGAARLVELRAAGAALHVTPVASPAPLALATPAAVPAP